MTAVPCGLLDGRATLPILAVIHGGLHPFSIEVKVTGLLKAIPVYRAVGNTLKVTDQTYQI